jgi:ATP-dependent RNA helicase DDX54/DBP10
MLTAVPCRDANLPSVADTHPQMPTPVQRKALPVILTGSDTCVMARTGSGKTIAFLIPILEKLLETPPTAQHKCRSIVLSPTRELSIQTLKVVTKLAHFCNINAIGINGGEGMEKQFNGLASKPDLIVATPGRLSHHLSEIPDFDLKGCLICVLDEADRLIEMGFAQQIRQIAATLPENCQKIMLSATMPKMLIEFTKTCFATDPQVVRLDNEASVSEELRIAFITSRSADKDAALLHTLSHIQRDKAENEAQRTGLTLIFAATRHHVEYITTLLAATGVDATMIYGTLHQDSRKQNLSDFRSGKKSVLVVTDVAARGIDVPLIDHVIHYQFPPSAKLFVHRSGRAARAGRIGWSWALVEPDEMPYMVDLHLFLGRKLSTGDHHYTLGEMTPDMVHYGCVPELILMREVENVKRILESEETGSLETELLRTMTKVCNNAMKQYRKTRPEASREGVRRAKAILEGERLQTGQRVGGNSIEPHPLLKGMEEKDYLERQKNITDGSKLQSLDNLKKREEFLRAMAAFRPKETIFEAFATGGGKDIGVASQIDRGKTTGGKKHDSSYALTAMKSMRRQMRFAHNKGETLVVAGSMNAQVMNGDNIDELVNDDEEDLKEYKEMAKLGIDIYTKKNMQGYRLTSLPVDQEPAKRPLSKAERKKLKKGETIDRSTEQETQAKKKKEMRGNDFRDESFFIENDYTADTAEAARSRQIEAAMQPSASANMKGSAGMALRLEEAMIDIVGDEQSDLAQKQRMMRWDKTKKKYVQTTVGQELSGDSKTKKIRLESGQLVKSDKTKLGELYEKWQKKTNRSIGRQGVFDEVTEGLADLPSAPVLGKVGGKEDKKKTATQIRKEREGDKNSKLKNMKKGDRRRLEKNGRTEKNRDEESEARKGLIGKKRGPSGRWASNSGGKKKMKK